MSDTLWEVQDGERVLGPYPEQQLLDAITARGLPPSTNVRQVGGEMWMPIRSRTPFADACRTTPAAASVGGTTSAPQQAGASSWRKPAQRAAIAAGTAFLVAVAGLVWYNTREQRQCEESIDRVKRSIDTGAWAAAANGLWHAQRLCAEREPAAISELGRRIEEHITATRNSAPAPDAPNPRREAAQAKLNAAIAVWDAFERLPLHKRTKEVWSDAIRESTSHGAGLSSPYEAQFTATNHGLMRKHGARLINEEAAATGENFTVLVPSSDRVKCVLWANQWIHESEGLRDLGFRKLKCEASTYLSKLTGKSVEEPALEWAVP